MDKTRGNQSSMIYVFYRPGIASLLKSGSSLFVLGIFFLQNSTGLFCFLHGVALEMLPQNGPNMITHAPSHASCQSKCYRQLQKCGYRSVSRSFFLSSYQLRSPLICVFFRIFLSICLSIYSCESINLSLLSIGLCI